MLGGVNVAVKTVKRYRVLKPIDHGSPAHGAEKMYVPPDYYFRMYGWVVAPEEVPSASHGKLIPVDKTGFIVLSDSDAADLTHGEIALLDPEAPPLKSGKIDRAVQMAKKMKDMGMEKTPGQIKAEAAESGVDLNNEAASQDE